MKQHIRLATAADSESILKIYAPYIADTAITFETEVPSVEVFSARIAGICQQYPYLVCEVCGETVGYAYASRHRERAAYCYDVDVSIYVSPAYQGSGVAAKLYACLFSILAELGYYNAFACYTVPNEKSRRFHENCGFTVIGTYHKTGYKLGGWHDVTWLEKEIAPQCAAPVPPRAITELSTAYCGAVFAAD